MDKNLKQELFFQGFDKLSKIIDLKGVQKFQDRQKKFFLYKLYGAFCDKKRRLLIQKLVLNASLSEKKLLWMIKQFYDKHNKKQEFQQRHIDLAYHLNKIFRLSNQRNANEVFNLIQGKKQFYYKSLLNLAQIKKIDSAHRLKELIFLYKQKYQDIVKFRLCYFLQNLFQRKRKIHFSFLKFYTLDKKQKYLKEFLLKELKNKSQKKLFNCFFNLLHQKNRHQQTMYFLSNFSLIFQGLQNSKLKTSFHIIAQKPKNNSLSQDQQVLYGFRRLQNFLKNKISNYQRIFFNIMRQTQIDPQRKQFALALLRLSNNDKMGYCFYKLRQNNQLSGHRYFKLLFTLHKIIEKRIQNTFQKLISAYRVLKNRERNKKSAVNNLHLNLNNIFYHNRINCQIKALNELKKKIQKNQFQHSNQFSVKNTIKVSNVHKQLVNKNKTLLMLAFYKWRQFKNGSIQNLFSLNAHQKKLLRDQYQEKQLLKQIQFQNQIKLLENLLKNTIRLRKLKFFRQIKNFNNFNKNKFRDNAMRIMKKKLSIINNRNKRSELYELKLKALKIKQIKNLIKAC